MTKEQLLGELKKMEQRISDLEAPGKNRGHAGSIASGRDQFQGLAEQSFSAHIFFRIAASHVSPKAAEILGYSADEIISSVALTILSTKRTGTAMNENIRCLLRTISKLPLWSAGRREKTVRLLMLRCRAPELYPTENRQ
jgi:hypothetical protein